MARKHKKLKIQDIHKNSSPEVSHAIKKIKENERKYTVLLSLSFMVVFCIFGYFSLRINYHYLSENHYLPTSSYSTSGETIMLNHQNILTDQEGLLSIPYHYRFSNELAQDMNYQILFVLDEEYHKICGCELFPLEKIHYSLDGKTVQTIPKSGILESGVFRKNSERDITLYLWVSDELNYASHYHAFLTMKKNR